MDVGSKEPWTLLESTLMLYLDRPSLAGAVQQAYEWSIGAEARANLDATLDNPSLSYRDIALIQLSYALCFTGIDTTQRPKGARAVGGRLGAFLKKNHVQAVADAYQNCGKNDANLVRGNDAAFDAFLRWMIDATREQLDSCFQYACSRIAAKSRPVATMPQLNIAGLTFGSVMGLFEEMLATPSQGANEQFIAASVLYALYEQNKENGPVAARVETKRLNASDKSSGAAGDIEVLIGNRALDAFEVTANDWHGKLAGAIQKMKEHDLARIGIIAPVNTQDYAAVSDELQAVQEDVAILDLHGFVAAMLSGLTKPYRNVALGRLYECLERYQEKVERVNAYVELLKARNLAIGTGE